MVSKCANPECSERFLYLHQGKLFQLMPTPEVAAVEEGFLPVLSERFWLCDRCSKTMTVVWGGTGAHLVPLPAKQFPSSLRSLQNQKPDYDLRRALQWQGAIGTDFPREWNITVRREQPAAVVAESPLRADQD